MRNFGHFFDLPRDLATTHQHISRTIACGKDVSYMYLQTCKAALASCFINLVINTVLCRKFPIFRTFSTTGSPVRYLPVTNRKFWLYQRVPREKEPLSMHLDESIIKFISAVHAPPTIWHSRHSAEMSWLSGHFTHAQWKNHLQPSFQRWIWVPPCIETWFITRHANIHPYIQVVRGENGNFLTSRGKPPYQAVPAPTLSRPT